MRPDSWFATLQLFFLKCNFELREQRFAPSQMWRRLNDVLWLTHSDNCSKGVLMKPIIVFRGGESGGQCLPHDSESSSPKMTGNTERERERERD